MERSNNECVCGNYKDKRCTKCSKCIRIELFGEESETFCECGNRMTEEQLTIVGVCNECR